MSIPPDDVPRSPSGRVPEWVKVESRGDPVPPTDWRPAAHSVAHPARPRRRRRRRNLAVVVLLGLLLGGLWTATDPQARSGALALGRAETWSGLLADARGAAERALGREPAASASPAADQSDSEAGTDMPPVGVGEHPARLAPVVAAPTASTAYSFAALQEDGVTPVTWSPCRVVSVVVNETGAPEGFWDEVVAVARELSDASGLVISVEGTTAEAPAPERAPYQSAAYGERWAPVLVGVAGEDTVATLAGDVAGLSQTNRAGMADGPWHIVSGYVYLDEDILDQSIGGGEPAWPAVLRHEMAHMIGLGHVADESQLMNEHTTTVLTYQDGDLNGIALLGQGACAPDL